MRSSRQMLLPRPVRMVLDSVVLLFTVSVLVPIVVIATILGSLIFLPLPGTIPAPKPLAIDQPTQVYDKNGNLIATFSQFSERIPVTEKDIPTVLKEAVVSVEDKNFYKGGAVDIRGSIRALLADLENQKTLEGGSTITQQYVKETYTNGARTISRKIKEAILASKLARSATKDEIMFQYLNTIYFGDGGYGIGAASENYFRVPVNNLNLSEAATLAGLIAGPSAWAPRENPAAAEARRELVLDDMLQQGYITQQQHDAAVGAPINDISNGETPIPNTTTVYPEQQVTPQYPAFVDYVKRYLLQQYGAQVVYTGGLRVQTTLDPTIQSDAEAAVQAEFAKLNDPNPNLEMGLAAVQPQTGFVQAIVGGRDFGGKGPYSQINFALGGCEPEPAKSVTVEVPAPCWSNNDITSNTGVAGRQPGSAWKPFVLATAFTQGIGPDTVFPAPTVFHIPGCQSTPTNSCVINNNEGEGGGSATLRTATAQSINTVFAELIRKTGCVPVGQMAAKLGITSAWYSSRVQTCSGAYALGEVGVSPLDMASAYGVFDDHGARAAPTPILKIIDGTGKVLVDNITKAPPATQVIDAVIADNVTNLLQGVISGGTATDANLGRPAAGKTGTTSNFTNAWFVGYTPTLSAAVWMGYANNQSTTLSFPGVGNVYGATIPAPVWKAFMTKALANVAPTDFAQPAPLSSISDELAAQALGGVTPGAPAAVTPAPVGGPYIAGPVLPNLTPFSPPTTAPPTSAPPTTGVTLPIGGTASTTTVPP
ncbi:MAG: transglycosylase domain-containing protein [Acidimicrobiales bacterium]